MSTNKSSQEVKVAVGSTDYDAVDERKTASEEQNDVSALRNQPYLVRTISSMGPRPHSMLGIILIMLGAFSFSCMFLFVKLLEGRANTFTLAWYRGWVEIPMALWFCTQDGESPLGPSSRQIRSWLLVRGGMGAAAVMCFFYAIQHLPLPDAITLQFTTPAFAAAFAVCFAGEKWMLLDMVGAVVCLLGVMLIAHGGAADPSDTNDTNELKPSSNLMGILVDLLGAAFAGCAYMSVRKIGHSTSANVMVLYYSAMSVPITLCSSKYFAGTWNVWGTAQELRNLGIWEWFLIVLTGVTAYAGQYLTNLGLQHESAATGTLATCSQIVFTYLFELMFLHEPINLFSVAGTVLIIGFMALVGFFKMKDATDHDYETVAGETEELALLFAAEHHS